jgi:hypothetical protein
MARPPPARNHPPTPALDTVGIALGTTPSCKKLKAEFGIKSNTHGKNTRGPAKATSRAKGLQSHHILQDAQTSALVSRAKAVAVILQDSTSGSEHGRITARQNARMKNKGGPGGPAATFGALKKEAKADLVAGLEGKRKGKTSGKPITKKQAEKLADCLVKEAEKIAKEEAKKKNMRPPLSDNTPIPPPGGCLTAGTLVWLANGDCRVVEALVPGDRIWTLGGPADLVRVDPCVHDIVELDLGDAWLRIATYHPLLDAAEVSGARRRADEFFPGERIRTRAGVRAVVGRRLLPAVLTYRLGFSGPTVCAVGSGAVLALMTDTGPPVIRSSNSHPAEVEECRS